MRKNKKISLLLATMMVAMAFTGCGEKEKETKETVAVETTTAEQAETTGAEEQTQSGESQTSDFDFSQVFDNIEIDGKKIPFPFSLNDLGEEFDIKYLTEMGDGNCCASLIYNDEKIASIYFQCNVADEVTRDTKVFGMDTSYSGSKKIYIKGMHCNSSLQEVENTFENLSKETNSNGKVVFSSAIDGDKHFILYYNENLCIESITLRTESE